MSSTSKVPGSMRMYLSDLRCCRLLRPRAYQAAERDDVRVQIGDRGVEESVVGPRDLPNDPEGPIAEVGDALWLTAVRRDLPDVGRRTVHDDIREPAAIGGQLGRDGEQ